MSELSPLCNPAVSASQIGSKETASLYRTCLLLAQCYGEQREERM